MVDGRALQLDTESYTRARAELVGVQAQTEPSAPPGVEHGTTLLRRERSCLAERVDPAGVRRAAASISPHTRST